MAIDRLNNPMYLGARVYIAPIGSTPASKTPISATALPTEPTSYAEPGDWTPLGKIKTFKPSTEYKTADVEGVDDTGAYKVTELKTATKRKFQFSTNDITREAFELTFGLLNPAYDDGDAQAVFASGSDSVDVWLYLDLTDAYRNKTDLASIRAFGKLSMQNPIEAKNEPALAEYELSIVPNTLSTFKAGGLGENQPTEDP